MAEGSQAIGNTGRLHAVIYFLNNQKVSKNKYFKTKVNFINVI